MKIKLSILLMMILFLSNCKNEKKENGESIKIIGTDAGWLLTEFIEFKNIAKVKIYNVNEPHYLDSEQWSEIQEKLKTAKSAGGIRCKPSGACLHFELNSGEILVGCVCGDLINFEERLFTGSFRMKEETNFHNY